MPSMHIKDTGAWDQLNRNEAHLKQAGTVEIVDNIYLKQAGVWYPMFSIIAIARWGYATYAGPDLLQNGHTGPQAFIDGLTTLMPSNDDNEQFTYQLPDGNTYGYFAVPKVMGTALFLDVNSGFTGAWDGAKWLDDFSNLSDTGPIEVTYDPGTGAEQWYVYRSDFAGPNASPVLWEVTYPNRP